MFLISLNKYNFIDKDSKKVRTGRAVLNSQGIYHILNQSSHLKIKNALKSLRTKSLFFSRGSRKKVKKQMNWKIFRQKSRDYNKIKSLEKSGIVIVRQS